MQILQPFDNLNVNNNAQFVPQSPIVQQPTTPQFNIQQQQYPQPQLVGDIPPSSVASIPGTANNRRPQVARGLQYKDSAYESRRQSSQLPISTGFTMESFRLLSVLGRGHFGKVILSQYKNTGKKICKLICNNYALLL